MFDTLRRILNAILRVYGLVLSLNPTVRLAIFVFSAVLTVWNWFNSLWATMFAYIDNLVAPTFGNVGVNASPLSLLNYVVPLDTLCTALAALLTFKAVSASVRIIKSFIPTIS